mmetsp:Transcript_6430/g.16345  ORF Transcript_6430/g.16345 Transcript_6430/m.16345 type:complete len:280 (-) Transcript_6430:77-916(-)
MDITSPLLLRDEDELEGSLLPPSSQQGLPVATRIDDEAHDRGHGGGHGGRGNTNQMNDSSAENTATPIATAAVLPVETFNYDDALASSVQEEEEEEYGEQQHQQYNSHQPTAYHVPGGIFDDDEKEAPRRSTAIADDSSTTVRHSTHIGVIQSEQEKDAIRQANRKVYSQTYHEKASIETANQVAKLRDREGLEVRHNNQMEHQLNNTSAQQDTIDQRQQRQQQQRQTKTTASTSNRSTPADTGARHGGGGGGYQIREYEIGGYETKSYNVKEYKSVYD